MDFTGRQLWETGCWRSVSTLPKIVLVDPEGREFEQSSEGMFMDGSFGVLKEVNPGVESSGHLVFDVPPASTRSSYLEALSQVMLLWWL
jgi:hypothetical protein